MGEALRRRLKQTHFESPHHEAILNLMVASASLHERFDRLCHRDGITQSQYNVLRILRGKFPEGYPRCEIMDRLIDRAPDVTRLIDRLERQGLVERAESSGDRRLSITRITRKGLDLVERMQASIDSIHEELARRLTPEDAGNLSRLCEAIYESEPDTPEARRPSEEKEHA